MYTDLIREVQSNPEEISPVEVAQKLLTIVRNYDPNKPVPIVDIVTEMGFSIKLTSRLPENQSGLLIIDPELKELIGNSKCVLISNKIKYGKRRFVLAHEIGHYLFDFNNDNIARYEHSFFRHYKKNNMYDESERKVNQFAAELLMPKDVFIKKYTEYKHNKYNKTDIIINLSEFFQTTIKSVEMRINELSKEICGIN